MGNPDISSLKAAFEIANSYNDWSTAVVVLGLVVEFVALLFFSKEMTRAEKTLLIVGSVLVTIGVGGEFVFSGRAAKAAIALQQASDERIAALNRAQEADHRIATTAAAHAADLGVTVDNLQGFVREKEKSADLNFGNLKAFVVADNARNAHVIEQLNESRARLGKAQNEAEAAAERAEKAATTIAGRTITPDQRTALIAFWKGGSKGPIVVGAKLFDEEAERYADQLTEVLNAAGFQATKIRGPFSFGSAGQWILLRDLRKWQTGPSYVADIQAGLTTVLHVEFEGEQMDKSFSEQWGDVAIAIGAQRH